jgi:hypothetical protein
MKYTVEITSDGKIIYTKFYEYWLGFEVILRLLPRDFETDPEVWVRFPALLDFLRGLERGPLGLLSTNEELLERKRSGSGLENREYGRRGSAALTTRHLSIRNS